MIRLNVDEIVDAETFHMVFARAFGFPTFYGENMDAWIDCMGYLDNPTAEMSTVHVLPRNTLALVIENAASFKSLCPAICEDLVEYSAFVNWRCIQAGGNPLLALAFHV